MQPQPLASPAAPPAPDDALLVPRARAGDRGAFEALYRRHAGRVHALCLRLCGDPQEAAGLTQDAFVRAWERLPGFRGESLLLTWLHRLTVNVVLDHRRAVRRRALTELDAGMDLPALAPAAPDRPGARLDLESAVGALPAGARTVFVLHDVEGYRLREVADLCGIAEGTAKSQLHRARRLLREVLA
ncbi:MAG TPA: RNA polymerase sigma factor [Candidatus Krumholzibacteria bacterium]|nr:RNA polymerase sigma factor [Candidatus Krumholzibacteria bacterium]HRX51367.1 RNA polymerase sigma factor [Candidatus Krumholzibacteria bacterium]